MHKPVFAGHLGKPLDKYFRGHPKVRILRPKERVGLQVARRLGMEAAATDLVVFLDSHVECTQGQNSLVVMEMSDAFLSISFF